MQSSCPVQREGQGAGTSWMMRGGVGRAGGGVEKVQRRGRLVGWNGYPRLTGMRGRPVCSIGIRREFRLYLVWIAAMPSASGHLRDLPIRGCSVPGAIRGGLCFEPSVCVHVYGAPVDIRPAMPEPPRRYSTRYVPLTCANGGGGFPSPVSAAAGRQTSISQTRNAALRHPGRATAMTNSVRNDLSCLPLERSANLDSRSPTALECLEGRIEWDSVLKRFRRVFVRFCRNINGEIGVFFGNV